MLFFHGTVGLFGESEVGTFELKPRGSLTMESHGLDREGKPGPLSFIHRGVYETM